MSVIFFQLTRFFSVWGVGFRAAAAAAARALPRLALEEESLILLNLPPELYPVCRLVSPRHNARIMHPGSPFHRKLTVYLDLDRLVVQPGEEATVPEWLQEIFDFIKKNKIVNVVLKNWTMPSLPDGDRTLAAVSFPKKRTHTIESSFYFLISSNVL